MKTSILTLVFACLLGNAGFIDEACQIRSSLDQRWLQGFFGAGDVHIEDQLGKLRQLRAFKAKLKEAGSPLRQSFLFCQRAHLLIFQVLPKALEVYFVRHDPNASHLVDNMGNNLHSQGW